MEELEVEFSVLGSVSVRSDGLELDLGPRLRRVLAILLVNHGRVVSTDRLVDCAWSGEPPDGAETSLKTYMTRLRGALDPDRAGLINFAEPGYVLSLGDASLDSETFESELDAATLRSRSDPDTAVALLSTALGRWRGAAYAGFAEEEWARPEAVRLEERRLEAAELLIETRLVTGDAVRAVSEAQSLTEAEPFRERPRELLMRALYATGRQADALREFQAYRSFLIEESGLDPSAELSELDDRVARGDASLSGTTRRLRGYELGERIGQGAHAVVHRAVQPGINREVAVKIIRPELADRPEFVRRFEQEAQAVASVEHPYVVPLYDYWREPGAAYLVMRLLRGGNVEQAIRTHGPFSRQATIDLLANIGGALQEAHRKGVVHRDVRPANLLLDEQGTAYLSDFGIALPGAAAGDATLTALAYAAPEMLRGEPVGVAADVLSLGVTTFELLTGRLPFADSDDLPELIRRQLGEPLPSVRAVRTDLPGSVDDVLARATAKAAEDRHTSVAAFVADLTAALDEPVARLRTVSTTLRDVDNPYLGLHAFEEKDAERFHGRESLITELVEKLESQPFVAVVGPSGSGKSSVVRAGLIPAIRRGAISGSQDWFVTTMVPGADPIEALETALLRVAVNPPASLRQQLHEDGGLLRAVKRVLPDDRTGLLLIVDQLEELFTMSGDEDQARLLTELSHAISAPGSPLRVVATLRADHYDAPLRHPGFADLVTTGTVTIRPMTPAALEEAITKPALAVGVEVEPALVASLVAGVSERPAALPLLQFALTEGFERRVSGIMLASTHENLGGLTGALAARADRIIEAGGPDDEAEARRMFGRLVTLGEGSEATRRRAFRSELGDSERAAWLLDAFTTARLVTLGRDETSRAPTVEVAHEALLRDWPRLRRWLSEDRNDLRLLRIVSTGTTGWIKSDRDHGELARGSRLEVATDLSTRRPELLNGAEQAWIEASRMAADDETRRQLLAIEHDRRQNRRLRRLLAAASVLAVVAVAGGAISVTQRNRAQTSEAAAIEAASLAQARELILAAEQARVDDPELGTLLATLAIGQFQEVGEVPGEAVTALRNAIAGNRVVERLPGSAFVAANPDGTGFAMAGSDGGVTIYDSDSLEPTDSFALDAGRAVFAQYSTDGTEIFTAVIGADGRADIWALNSGGEPVERLPGPEGGFDPTVDLSVAVSGNGDVVERQDTVMTVWSRADGDPLFERPAAPFSGFDFAADGRLAYVAGDADGNLLLNVIDGMTGAQFDSVAIDTFTPRHVRFSPDGRRVALANDEGWVGLVDLDSDDQPWRPVLLRRANQPMWSPDGLRLLIGGERPLKILDADTGVEIAELAAGSGGSFAYAWIPGTDRVVMTTYQDETLVLDLSGASPEAELSLDSPIAALGLRVTPDGDTIVARAGWPGFAVSDLRNGDIVAGVEPRDPSPLTLDIGMSILTPDGRFASSLDEDMRYRIWPTAGGEPTYAADPEWVIVGLNADATLSVEKKDRDPLARLVDTRTNTVVAELAVGDWLSFATFSPDDRYVIAVTALETDSSRVFDTSDGTEVARFGGPDNEDTGLWVKFVPAGDTVVVATPRGDVIIFDFQAILDGAPSGEAVRRVIDAHDSFIFEPAISADGALLATTAQSGPARVWDVASGRLIGSVGTDGTSAVAFDPTKPTLYVADGNTITGHTLDVDALVAIGRSTITRQLTEGECQQYLRGPCIR